MVVHYKISRSIQIGNLFQIKTRRHVIALALTQDGHDGVFIGFARLFVKLDVLGEAQVAHDAWRGHEHEAGAHQALGVNLSHRIAQTLALEVVQKVHLALAAPNFGTLFHVSFDLQIVRRAEEINLFKIRYKIGF